MKASTLENAPRCQVATSAIGVSGPIPGIARQRAIDSLQPELLSLRQQRAVELRDHPHAVLEERIGILLKAAHTREGLTQLDLRAHQG